LPVLTAPSQTQWGGDTPPSRFSTVLPLSNPFQCEWYDGIGWQCVLLK